ncbi:uncharacterized protein BDZ99DRAFT_33807 [Mytilinidion resinicola]|uniref:Uncharacterized protein n=1 Tax=Mytilinidion resinicola TaxID=574789 RepID=A0A6A6YLB1_9PEZI|nr:uncharacterized protein BDZ99DRAFT_33807 [Mytilinidion resinicola]KAF2809666.1 hypothetical protein BDZ99DRAFT_33807 [Mytilinidion resinicola]
MDVDQESDPSVSQPKEKPIVESILQRDHTSSLSPLSEVPTEKTGTPLQEPAVLSEAEASEGSEAASQKPSTPMQNFSRSLLLREINGLALLALKEKPTMAEIAEWFCKTLPSHKKANMVRLKKTLGPVLTQHKHFLGSSEGGDRKRWRFSAREIKQMYARDLADCFEAASIPSPNQSPSGSEDESLEIERESDFQLTASSPLASSQGGSHWQQVTRGIYKLSKGPAPNGDLEVYSRARTVHLKDECYSTESEVKYSHPDGKGDGKEAWGKIDRIELLDNGRCQIRTLRYVDKNEASALGCKNLREWPRNVRYMRRRQSVMDEISGDDLRGCLSPRESNSVSPALYLSLEDKCKIRVDYSVVGDNQMRHGVDWVESSSDVEDIGTLPEPSPRNRTSNKSRTLQEQASGGHQEDLASSKDQVAQPVPTDKHPKELSAPLVTQPDEGSMAVQSDPISPNPSVRSSGRGRDTMRTALTSSIATDSTPRSEPLFVPTTKISPKRAIVSKDFNAAFPEYVSWDAEERARKIKEIQQRPSRKATFGKKLAFARTHRSNPHVEIEPPKKLLAKKPRSSSPEVVSDKQPSGELSDSSESQKDEQEDGNGLKKLLGLPPSFIPIVYENQLAFRDGTLVS